jgi:hypothetical protein
MLNPFAPLMAFAQRAIPFTAPSPAPVVVTIRVTHLAKKALKMRELNRFAVLVCEVAP